MRSRFLRHHRKDQGLYRNDNDLQFGRQCSQVLRYTSLLHLIDILGRIKKSIAFVAKNLRDSWD